MTSVIDVGDAVELTFHTAPGATVSASWFNPAGRAVLHDIPVPESPPGTGAFPKTFVPDQDGMWKALFKAFGAATAVEPFYVRALAVTGPAPLAAVGEVVEVYRSLSAGEEGLVSALLRHASRMLRSRFSTLDTRIGDGSLEPGQAALAAVQMVLRVLRNPKGLKAEQVGPFTRTFDTASAAGLLAVTDAEVALVGRRSRKRRRASTIRVQAGLAPRAD